MFKAYRFITLFVAACAVSVVAAQASAIVDYDEVFKQAVSKANIKSLMDVSLKLKKAGASYVPEVAMPAELVGRSQSSEAQRVLIGMYQFDAIHAAAFGRKRETMIALGGREELVDRLNLRGKLDISALFPPELNKMASDPESVNVEALIESYVDNAPKFAAMIEAGPEGAELIEASLYGFALQGLYVVSQSLLVLGDTQESRILVRQMSDLLEPATSIYSSFTKVDDYAKYVDPQGFLEVGERNGWMRMVLNLIKQQNGVLTEEQIEAIADFVSKERSEILAVMF